jgi:hypothetical protein
MCVWFVFPRHTELPSRRGPITAENGAAIYSAFLATAGAS